MNSDITVKPRYFRKALLIINPVSGKKLVLRHVSGIIRRLMDAGYIVTTMVTAERGEAQAMAAEFGAEYELVCCTGGDGTLNEVVSGLASAGLQTPLGYIPCGSTNDFALSRSLSFDIDEAALNIASGRLREFDIGRFGDRYFSYVAAFGAFSWLSYTTDQNRKNVLGRTAYIIDGIKDAYKIKPIHMKLICDGTVYEDEYIFGALCNTTSIAGRIELPATLAKLDDGQFEILLIKMPRTIAELEHIIHSLILQDYSSPLITLFRAERLTVFNDEGQEWSLDGEQVRADGEMEFTVMPKLLRLQG